MTTAEQDTITITLTKPIKRGEQEITSVQIRNPGVIALGGVVLGDLLRMHTDEVLRVLPRITEPALQRHELNQLDPADLMDMAGELSNFFISDRMRNQAEV